MTPSRPYLVRAIHDWIVDNRLTPQLVVDAGADGASLPQEYAQDGRITLNISASAVRGLKLGNERVEFSARFGGVPREVIFPTSAVVAVYARENGIGMAFQEQDPGPGRDPDPGDPPGDGSGRPSLRVVK